MNLEQLNVDLVKNFKKKIKVEAVDLGFTHIVVMNAIIEDFYKRHPSPAARRKFYAAMKAKLAETKGELELPPDETANTIHHVELAEAAAQ